MSEYEYFDGDHFIIFDIIDVNEENKTITIVISNQGRITQETFELFYDEKYLEQCNDDRYFKYGLYQDKIPLCEFDIL